MDSDLKVHERKSFQEWMIGFLRATWPTVIATVFVVAIVAVCIELIKFVELWAPKFQYQRPLSAFGLAALFLTIVFLWVKHYFWNVQRTDNKSADPVDSSSIQETKEVQKTAVLVVHGIGVQEKYETLTTVFQGFTRTLEANSDFGGRLKIIDSEIGAESRCFEIHRENRITRIEMFEAFWGDKFNGKTTWQSTLLFVLKSLPVFLKTAWQPPFQNILKRSYELIFACVVISAIGFSFLLFSLSTEASQKLYIASIRDEIVTTKSKKSSAKLDSDELKVKGELNKKKLSAQKWLENNGFNDTWVEILKLDARSPKLNDRAKLMSTFGSESLGMVFYHFKNGLSFPSLNVLISGGTSTIMEMPLERLLCVLAYVVLYVLTFTGACRLCISVSYELRHGVTQRRNRSSRELDQNMWIRLMWPTGLFGALLAALDTIAPLRELILFVPFMLLYGFLRVGQYWMTSFFGDVQIYANTNENATFYPAKQEATNVVKEKLVLLCDKYENVIVVAHSLGGCIALNALREQYIGNLELLAKEGKPKCDEKCPQYIGNLELFAKEDKSKCDDKCPQYIGNLELFAKEGKFKCGEKCPDANRKFVLPRRFITVGAPIRKFRLLYTANTSKEGIRENNHLLDEVLGKKVPWLNFWYFNDIVCDPIQDEGHSKLGDRGGFVDWNLKDVPLGWPPRLWTHSDYWTDKACVARIIEECEALN